MVLHPRHPGFLCICSGVAALICASSVYAAEAVRIRVETLTYKKVGNLEIKADLHRPNDEALRPVVVWLPGGEHGLGGGDRKRIDAAYQSALEFVKRHTKGKTNE